MTATGFKPGLYEHSATGGRYIALFLLRHHETNEVFVAYVSCTHGTNNIREYASPGKDSWCDMVLLRTGPTFELNTVPRFRYLGEALT